jgi:hypothetical protein
LLDDIENISGVPVGGVAREFFRWRAGLAFCMIKKDIVGQWAARSQFIKKPDYHRTSANVQDWQGNLLISNGFWIVC